MKDTMTPSEYQLHLMRMQYDPEYKKANQGKDTLESIRAKQAQEQAASNPLNLYIQAYRGNGEEAQAVQDATMHTIKMKHDSEYRAEYEAKQAIEVAKAVDVQKATFHSTMTVNGVGGVTHEDSAELQKMAAVLATMEIVGSPDEKLRIMRGYLDGSL